MALTLLSVSKATIFIFPRRGKLFEAYLTYLRLFIFSSFIRRPFYFFKADPFQIVKKKRSTSLIERSTL